MKKILLVTHHKYSDTGIISNLLHSKFLICNISFKNLPLLNQNDISEFEAIIIFGGKMSANSKSIHIKNEYKFLSKAIKLNKKIIGICLGAQLIAKFYGSLIKKSKKKEVEIGYRNTKKINNSIINNNSKFLQFHNEGISINSNMEILSTGNLFDVDAFKIKNNEIYGFQFHPEVNSKMIKDWYSNLKLLNKGTDSLSKILKEHKIYQKKNYFWLNKILNRLI
ncbi:gamma-glutamyl-gamma-aminobutyrate hydrolase family protein [Alphaproteobacteria bacterium]|nr:gamma-glutamyl-gamma-aminobutyrate hydrolase family protein [Alphaproteobacteria bacterium]